MKNIHLGHKKAFGSYVIIIHQGLTRKIVKISSKVFHSLKNHFYIEG